MPSTLWTLNNLPFADLGLEDGTLTEVNQQANTLVLTGVLDEEGEPALPAALAYGQAVVLRRGGEVWFRGTVRDIDVSVDRERRITVRGGWDVLERKAYRQNFKAPADPDDPESELVEVKRGRVVLGQDDAGLRVSLATFLASVIEYAGLVAGEIDTELEVPFEDAVDQSCASVITRQLRWLPNSVVEVDDTAAPAVVHIRQRAGLEAVVLTLGVDPLQAPLRLKPRYDLRVEHVLLEYLATNRANTASWETVTTDAYPPGTTGDEPGALVRTIELGGSISDRSYLVQEVQTDEIPAALTDGSLASAWVHSGAVFDSCKNWWKTKRPELAVSGVEIKAFRGGRRYLTIDGETAPTSGLRELISGGLAEWMVEDDAELVVEEQTAEIQVAYEQVDPEDATKRQQQTATLTAPVRATNAQTRTYTQLESASGTDAEEVPEGLAQALYEALSGLQWEGELVLIEEEATAWARPGQAVNVEGGEAEWAEMAAVVQMRQTELGLGRTTITLGPPRQVEPDGLVNIYRTNRNRRPSTSYLVRATGRTGGAAARVQAPLPVKQPIEPAQGAMRNPPRVYTQAVTVAGVVPTVGEIRTALQAVYGSTKLPAVGDVVNLTVAGAVKWRAVVSSQGTAAGRSVVDFAVGGVTYYGACVQTELY